MKRTEGKLSYIFQRLAQGKPDSLNLNQRGQRQAARDWYRKVASEIQSVNVPNLFRGNERDRVVKTISYDNIGQMITFNYDAKLKDKLPYWDRVPLIFPIEVYADGFLGINLHYLPPMYRAKLMDALYTTMNNDKYDATTKLQISYSIMKGVQKFRYFEPCIKRYLNSHVQSQFVRINPDEWDMALMLPTERFVKKRKEFVWSESVKRLGRRRKPR
jgi:hypothetical protein